MQEIWIPELVITLFLFLPLARPFSKKLAALDGLARLPALGFLIALALVPAYGFRPETLPLLIYAAIMTAAGFFRVTDKGGFGKAGLFLVIAPLVLLAAAAETAFFFTPPLETALSTRGVYNIETPAVKAREGEYFIRVYAGENETNPRRPLLVLLPPALGSLPAIDRVSGELKDRGFTVVSYSRRGFDSPAVYAGGEREKRFRKGPFEWFRRFRVLTGTASAKAAARGRALEDERKKDIEFLLGWIRGNPRVSENAALFDMASPDAVFLAGYDAGGSALLLLENSLLRAGTGNVKIRGLAVIESRLWSVYREETPELPALPPDAGRLESAGYGFKRWFLETKPKKISGLNEVPEISAPLLLLVSDKSREPKHRDSRYQALLKCFNSAQARSILASADGAGPFDYSDFPVKYPLITALFPGRKKPAWENIEAPGNTAAVIAHFAAGVLEAGGEKTTPLREAKLPAGLRVERRN